MSTTPLLSDTLDHLRRLVALDTTNPPRKAEGVRAAIEFIREALGSAFTFDLSDWGDGCFSLLGKRGANPRLLFNVHLDTVPATEGWSGDPFDLMLDENHPDGRRAIGLGCCDIKGAAAALLTAARTTSGDAAILFTTDEEQGESRCVRSFLGTADTEFDAVIVAEPTQCRAVVAHRGLTTCSGEFTGRPGHASEARALHDSALHAAIRWAAAALEYAAEQEARSYGAMRGVRFNLGTLSGGTKPNMIAGAAALRFAVRPLPDQRVDAVLREIQALTVEGSRVKWTPGFQGPPLPAATFGSGAAADREAAARAVAARLGIEVGDAVDFWTEASLFSEAGHTALVYGPGAIAQAHAPDEWVALDQLATAAATYARLLS